MENNEISQMPFGELLRTYRKRAKVTQRQLAEKVGVHYNTVWAWEGGDHLPETKSMMLEVARHLRLNDHDTRCLLEASLTALSPYWYIPYPRNRFFSGREEVLNHLHTVLCQEQAVALSGLGGIGKTQTALEYAYRSAHAYFAVFWVTAETPESIIASFSMIAALLSVSEQRESDQQRVVAMVSRWLTNHRDWLLIVDNVEDIDVVKPFLPSARHGSLLFTTRMQALGTLAQPLELQPMTEEEGIRFLCKRTRRLEPTASLDHLAEAEKATARKIVAAMGGLPLALDQAGAYIEATCCSLSSYLQLFQLAQQRLLDERGIHTAHSLSVVRTFTLVFKRLENTNTAAAEFLTACAFLAAEAIPETLFIEGAAYLGSAFEALALDPFAFQAAIKELLAHSLIQRHTATQTVTIHRLVQEVLKGQLPEAVQHTWAIRITRALTPLFPSETTHADYWRTCDCLLPHALVCVAYEGQWNEEEETVRVTLLLRMATYLSKRAQFARAESLYRQASSLAERVFGSESHLLAEALHGLAYLYAAQGRYAEAEPLHQRALSLAEHTLGQEHLLVAEIRYWLATLYASQGKYTEAEPLFLQSCQTQERLLGQEHPLLIETLGGRAYFHFLQGKYDESSVLYQRAIALCEQMLGSQHTRLAVLLNNLAELYLKQGWYERAEPLLQQTRAIWEQAFGPEHAYLAYPLHSLAEVYSQQEQYNQAESFYKQALDIKEKALGPDHPEIVKILHGMARLSCKQGRYVEAEPLYMRSLTIGERQAGPAHPDVARSLTGLAELYERWERYEQAESLLLRACAIFEQCLGSTHAETVKALTIYHRLLEHRGE